MNASKLQKSLLLVTKNMLSRVNLKEYLSSNSERLFVDWCVNFVQFEVLQVRNNRFILWKDLIADDCLSIYNIHNIAFFSWRPSITTIYDISISVSHDPLAFYVFPTFN